jgi:hypothetical protein
VPFRSFDDLRQVFRDEARDAFLDLVQRRPGEQICAFALVTDDDISGASGAGDTIERREHRLATKSARTRREAKYHAWEYVWHPAEWDDIYTEELPNSRPQRISAKEYFHGMLSFRNTWTSQAGHSDRGFRRNALRAMTEALADLDSEGLFGTGKERESITIFLDITDSNDSDECEVSIPQMKLNPRVAAKRLKEALPVSGKLTVFALGLVRWIVRGRLISSHKDTCDKSR